MIPSTEYLHNAIRSGQVECLCPGWTKEERLVTHLPGCRWNAYIFEIYRLERHAEGIGGDADNLKLSGESLDGNPSGE